MDIDISLPVIFLPNAEAIRITNGPAVQVHAPYSELGPACGMDRSFDIGGLTFGLNHFHQARQSELGPMRSLSGHDQVGFTALEYRLNEIPFLSQFPSRHNICPGLLHH